MYLDVEELRDKAERGGSTEELELAVYLLQENKKQNDVDYQREAVNLLKGLVQNRQPLAEAQYYLAECYGSGMEGLDINHDQALNLYVQASKQNHPEATFRAAKCYEYGIGTRKDKNRATKFYRKAAALGEPLSMHKLALILLGEKEKNPKTYKEGFTWLKRAAMLETPDPESVYHLASQYEPNKSRFVIPDERYAFELYMKAAELGSGAAQYRVGECYDYGLLYQQPDPHKAFEWYSKAALLGYSEAEFAMSGWYLTGSDFLEQDDNEAYIWAKKAADKEFPKAEYVVGEYSEKGIGVEKSLDEAIKWYIRAAAHGNKKARNRLAELKEEGTEIKAFIEKSANTKKKLSNKAECVVQ